MSILELSPSEGTKRMQQIEDTIVSSVTEAPMSMDQLYHKTTDLTECSEDDFYLVLSRIDYSVDDENIVHLK